MLDRSQFRYSFLLPRRGGAGHVSLTCTCYIIGLQVLQVQVSLEAPEGTVQGSHESVFRFQDSTLVLLSLPMGIDHQYTLRIITECNALEPSPWFTPCSTCAL